MQIQAAVVEEKAGPFVLRDLEIEAPRSDELLIRIVATGVCQTDAHVRDQEYAIPLPVVLGHEGAGIVEKIGEHVRGIAVGDRVVLSYPSCGQCGFCLEGHGPYCQHGFQLCFGGARLDGSNALKDGVHGHFFAQSSFATYSIANERNVVKVPDDVPLELMGPLGCGIQTGAGAVLNSLQVRPGASIAVFGTGTVGLAAIMAARVAGCRSIIAVDINDDRLDLSKDLGATHSINGSQEDIYTAVMAICDSGVDYVLDTTAQPKMLKLAVDVLALMGTVGLVGGAPMGTNAAIDMNQLLAGRRIRGIVQGDSTPQVFIPKLIDMYRRGEFPFDKLVRYYDFDEINRAFADAKAGLVVKPVLRIGKMV